MCEKSFKRFSYSLFNDSRDLNQLILYCFLILIFNVILKIDRTQLVAFFFLNWIDL